MTSPYFNWDVFLSRYQMQASFFFVLLLVWQALQNYVGFIWLLDGHHLNSFVIFIANQLRKWKFTNLTLKFSKIIRGCYSFQLSFDFAIDPGF